MAARQSDVQYLRSQADRCKRLARNSMDAETNQSLLGMAEDFEARALQVKHASIEAAQTQFDMLQNTLKRVYPLADDMIFADLIRALDGPGAGAAGAR